MKKNILTDMDVINRPKDCLVNTASETLGNKMRGQKKSAPLYWPHTLLYHTPIKKLGSEITTSKA